MPGVKGKSGRKISTPPPWGSLYKAAGGQAGLAERLGVSMSTVGKWAHGTHRTPAIVKKELLRMCKRFGITEGVEEFSTP